MRTIRIVHTRTDMDSQAHAHAETHAGQPGGTSLTVAQHFLVESDHGVRPGGTDHGQQQRQQQAQPACPSHGSPGPCPPGSVRWGGDKHQGTCPERSRPGQLKPTPARTSQAVSGDPSPAHDLPHVSFCISARARIPFPACFIRNHGGIWSGNGPQGPEKTWPCLGPHSKLGPGAGPKLCQRRMERRPDVETEGSFLSQGGSPGPAVQGLGLCHLMPGIQPSLVPSCPNPARGGPRVVQSSPHPVPGEECPKCRPLTWPPAPPDPAQLGGLGERESGGTGGHCSDG